jgi:hypothetical protein
MTAKIFLKSSSKILVSTQTLMTLTSIAYSAFGGRWLGRTKHQKLLDSDTSNEVPDAAWYQTVTDLVTDMYSGKGATARQPERGVARLASDASFEDPAAICNSQSEIEEAFRALQWAHPTPISRPKLVDVVPKGETIQLIYSLHQQYTIFLANLQVRSLLVVDVNLKQLKDTPHYSELEVTRIEEQWNGVKPLGFAFWFPRRFNGILSYYTTSNLLSSPEGGPPPNSKKTKFFITSNNGR